MPSDAGADVVTARHPAGVHAPGHPARCERGPALAVLRPVVSSGAMYAAASDTLHAARELEAAGIERGGIASGRAPQGRARSGGCAAPGVRTAAWPSLRDLSGRTR